jgi:hypothetical protein
MLQWLGPEADGHRRMNPVVVIPMKKQLVKKPKVGHPRTFESPRWSGHIASLKFADSDCEKNSSEFFAWNLLLLIPDYERLNSIIVLVTLTCLGSLVFACVFVSRKYLNNKRLNDLNWLLRIEDFAVWDENAFDSKRNFCQRAKSGYWLL